MITLRKKNTLDWLNDLACNIVVVMKLSFGVSGRFISTLRRNLVGGKVCLIKLSLLKLALKKHDTNSITDDSQGHTCVLVPSNAESVFAQLASLKSYADKLSVKSVWYNGIQLNVKSVLGVKNSEQARGTLLQVLNSLPVRTIALLDEFYRNKSPQ